MIEPTVLTDRFDRALLYATHVHGGQVRKGTGTPYVAHLLAVAATVLEYGGDECERWSRPAVFQRRLDGGVGFGFR